MFWLILSVAIWGIVHSVLATIGVKEWVSRTLGNTGRRFYRLGYNLFSIVSLVPSIWLWLALPDEVVYQIGPPWVFLTTIGQLLAVAALVLGVMQTGALSFVGLRQLFESNEAPDQFVTSGLYRWVRHPLYTAGLVFMWLTPIVTRNTLVFFISATTYLIVGSIFEERKLTRQFGSLYAEYKSTTPMLIPGMVLRRNK